MIHKLHNYVDSKTMLMLYHILGYSYIQYGITVLGTAAKLLLHKIEVKQNNTSRTISWSTKYCHITLQKF